MSPEVDAAAAMRPSLASQWSSYRAAVVPSTAGPTQIQECRRAFYAGAQAVLMLQMQISAADAPNEVGVEFIQSLHQECSDFAQQVKAGQA